MATKYVSCNSRKRAEYQLGGKICTKYVFYKYVTSTPNKSTKYLGVAEDIYKIL